VVGAEVDTEHRSGAQLFDRRWRGERILFPGGVQIPAIAGRVEGNVVAHRTPVCDPISPLEATVVERRRRRDIELGTQLG
jgi:hypothetical protein